jgi:hypothetical protein
MRSIKITSKENRLRYLQRIHPLPGLHHSWRVTKSSVKANAASKDLHLGYFGVGQEIVRNLDHQRRSQPPSDHGVTNIPNTNIKIVFDPPYSFFNWLSPANASTPIIPIGLPLKSLYSSHARHTRNQLECITSRRTIPRACQGLRSLRFQKTISYWKSSLCMMGNKKIDNRL